MQIKKFISAKVALKVFALGVILSVSTFFLYGYSLNTQRTLPTVTTEYYRDINKFLNSDVTKKSENESKRNVLLKDSSSRIIPPDEIRNRRVVTQVLNEDHDYMYKRVYDKHFNELPRRITYLDLKNSNGYGFYQNTYSGIDCLGVGFNQTFQNEEPIKKEQCENAIKQRNNDLASYQKINYDRLMQYENQVNAEADKIAKEEKRRGIVEKWAYTDPLSICNKVGEYKDSVSKNKDELFDTKDECNRNHIREQNSLSYSNDAKKILSNILLCVFFISFVLFLPLALCIIKNALRLFNYIWFSFVSNTFKAINSSEKKIKIDADLNIKDKKEG